MGLRSTRSEQEAPPQLGPNAGSSPQASESPHRRFKVAAVRLQSLETSEQESLNQDTDDTEQNQESRELEPQEQTLTFTGQAGQREESGRLKDTP